MSNLKWASDDSGFMKCDVCNKDVPMECFEMHDCKLEDNIWSTFDASKEAKHAVSQKAPEVKKKEKTYRWETEKM